MPANAADLPRALRVLLGSVVAKRYVVDEFLGRGGMAVVFRGRHATLARKVAIKFMRPEYSNNPEVSRRFDREARAASNFDHPHCIQVFDCGETEHGLKFIVMPLLEGVELGEVLGKPLPPSQVVWLAMQLLRGLEHAHGHGVVHRDLKPDNVFVTRDHEGREMLKIVDFGIAKVVDKQYSDGLQTKVGAIVGTPAYMSPEQAMGGDIDPRADLYSLGVILYHMLTGAPPFKAADPRGLLFQQVTTDPKPLPESIPQSVRTHVEMLLNKERDDRPATATASLAAFERVATELQADPRPWVQLLAAHPPPRMTRLASPAMPPAAHASGPMEAAGPASAAQSTVRTPEPPPARPPSPAPPSPAVILEPTSEPHVAVATQVYGPDDIPRPTQSPVPPVLRHNKGDARSPRRLPPSKPNEPRDSESSGLEEMDAALKKVLEQQTFVAEDNLRSGIFEAPAGGWELDDLENLEDGDEGPGATAHDATSAARTPDVHKKD